MVATATPASNPTHSKMEVGNPAGDRAAGTVCLRHALEARTGVWAVELECVGAPEAALVGLLLPGPGTEFDTYLAEAGQGSTFSLGVHPGGERERCERSRG